MLRKSMIASNTALALVAMANASAAEVLAFTNFDDKTLTTTTTADDTATNLNWMLNGLDDPGDLAAQNEAMSSGIALFSANTFVEDIFIPGINTGNGNTSWFTTVPLTVASGSDVTLTDVTFDYLAVSGGQALNVSRRSDFILKLFDPSANEVDSVTITDAISGTNLDPMIAPVTATFTTPIALTEAGTYTLQIQGGDLFIVKPSQGDPGQPIGANETGNHTGIDNLSINGTLGGGFAPGDTDMDGDIDDSDLGTSFANYTGPVGAAGNKTAAEGDTDGDGDVDDSDLGTSFAGYTGPQSPAAVPEPTSLALLGLGGLLIARRRRA